MYKTFLFSFAVVFCVDVCVLSAKEISTNDVAIAQPDISDFITVDTAEEKGWYIDGSELKVAREDECKCKNGKCMRKCDMTKTIPCEDDTKVCVCDPEFAETDPGVCKYCNCGYGFNCTFKWYLYEWKKYCICPEGYYNDRYTDKCTVECSEKQPCRNGGKCMNKVCSCPSGTAGVMCEELLHCSDCVNRLEVDCLYDQIASTSYCSCKNSSLYYDYGRDICIPCPCGNGRCSYEVTFYSRKLKCECYSGYKEYNGYCKECDCGLGGYCHLDLNGEKVCQCSKGYYEREGRCYHCNCMRGTITECEVTGNEKRCFCNKGYQSVLGYCEDINECETNNTCHPSTTCYNRLGTFECQCPDGFRGYYGSRARPGEQCEDINECKESSYACYYARYAKCVNIPGSFKCECKPGYEPYSYKLQPEKTSCIETAKSWGPALIVIFTSCALLIVSCFMHICVKKRAARPN